MGKQKKKSDTLKSRKMREGKIARSETVSVRFEPRLRYLIELAARKQRRTLSSFIEWVLEDSLNHISLGQTSGLSHGKTATINEEASRLWDVSEPDRLVRLHILYPELLNHEEQKIIDMLSIFFTPAWNLSSDGKQFWDWNTLTNRVLPRIREEWPGLLESYAEGKTDVWKARVVKTLMEKGDYLQPASLRAKTRKDFPLKS